MNSATCAFPGDESAVGSGTCGLPRDSQDGWWQPYRQREHERIRSALDTLAEDFVRGSATRDRLAEGSAALRLLDARVDEPGWLAPRPRRRMPAMWKIVQHWQARGEFAVNSGAPHCFACGDLVAIRRQGSPRDRWNSALLVKAHLYDRCFDGLDGPQNMVPMCQPCHDGMPVFRAGVNRDPVAWVRGQRAS